MDTGRKQELYKEERGRREGREGSDKIQEEHFIPPARSLTLSLVQADQHAVTQQ